jgi:glycosyltransferase involved in cell wall biosynthesis
MRICAIVPTYDNPATVATVVRILREHLGEVIVVDDGGGREAREILDELATLDGVTLVRREQNGGKGAAVKAGLEQAARLGVTHALQVDADGQHDLRDVPRFVKAARAHPEALVLGTPRFDSSAPLIRRFGRKLTQFWNRIETVGHVIDDPMCGFRVYPVTAALTSKTAGNAMDFDPEIVVRLAWAGMPVINLETQVRYLLPDEGGVSHFRMLRDNLLITWMHTRMVFRLLALVWSRPRPRRMALHE